MSSPPRRSERGPDSGSLAGAGDEQEGGLVARVGPVTRRGRDERVGSQSRRASVRTGNGKPLDSSDWRVLSRAVT